MSKFIFLLIIILVFSSLVYLQFVSPTLCDPDSYYHVAVSNFIKDYGPHYQFRWSQFSTLKDFFSDKDFLFHVFIVPFLHLTDDPVLAGKYALIFYTAIFLLSYVFILRKYLPDTLAGVFLLFPLLSSMFSSYLLQLRSVTVANILMILGIYFLINKRLLWVFILSLIYPLTHISFFMIIVLALICEGFRYIYNKDFFAKNIYIVIIGTVLGCLLHPNFPNNFVSLYLNGILVPFYRITGIDLGFGSELQTLNIRFTLVNNFAVFFTLNIILWASILTKKKMSLSTSVWLAASNIYLILTFSGIRYWYQVNALFFIFLASYVNDWIKDPEWNRLFPKVKVFIALYLVITFLSLSPNMRQVRSFMDFFARKNRHFENVGRWMEKHMPENETIYHSYWSDSSYFMCLNPKNNYINCLDPIYMYHYRPVEFDIMENLTMGRINNPHEVLRKIFKVRYGYIRNNEPLYRQVSGDPSHFEILYDDNRGMVFKILQ